MEPIEYLRAIRRRWAVLVATIAVAVAAGWLTTGIVDLGPKVSSYEATAVMLNTGASGVPGVSNLQTIAALARVGDVPARVAKALKFDGDPLVLARGVEIGPNTDTGTIHITAIASTAERAEAVANTFARELLAFIVESRARTFSTQLEGLSARLDHLSKETANLDRKIAAASGTEAALLREERNAKVRQYGLAYEQYQALAASAASADPPLQIIQLATAIPEGQKGFSPPTTPLGRLAFAGGVGLFAGIALVFVLERFDTRIRTKRSAEEHFELPVVAEIPAFRAGRGALGPGAKDSVARDAFRMLAAGVARSPSTNGASGNGAHPHGPPHTILVTSAGPSEGKTTVVANLAAAFGELGRSVVVLSCDFRRPSIHRLFKVPNEPGVSDVIRTPNGTRALAKILRSTPLERVHIAPSGSPATGTTELFGTDAMRSLIDEAVAAGDVVLIDSAPVLASDTAHLVPDVDAVLVVARAGKTSPETAERASELLKRLGTPLLGVALNCASEIPVPRRYYRRSSR